MFRRSMNNQIKIVLFVRGAQLPSHDVCLIRRTRNVHFSSIWSQKLPQSLSRMVAKMRMVMAMVRSVCCF
jgi:hypothetical protein